MLYLLNINQTNYFAARSAAYFLPLARQAKMGDAEFERALEVLRQEIAEKKKMLADRWKPVAQKLEAETLKSLTARARKK